MDDKDMHIDSKWIWMFKFYNLDKALLIVSQIPIQGPAHSPVKAPTPPAHIPVDMYTFELNSW